MKKRNITLIKILLWVLFWPFMLGYHAFTWGWKRNKVVTGIVSPIVLVLIIAFGSSGQDIVPVNSTPITKQGGQLIESQNSQGRNETNPSSNTLNSVKSNANTSPIALEKVVVSRHVDGDTIYIKFENGTEDKVRFIGVNTPETVSPIKGVEEYGKEASNFTKDKLLGKSIYIEKDVSERDKYNRLLRYIWLDIPKEINEQEVKTKMFNAILVSEGYAQVATYPPDVKYQDIFLKLQSDARNQNKGLWGITSTETAKTTSTTQKNVQQTQTKEQTVYITNTGEKYHRLGCRSLRKSQIPININDAIARGYEPCSICNP